MTEHVHRWRITVDEIDGFDSDGDEHTGWFPRAHCECGEKILWDWEIERRLNATERLHIGYAKAIRDHFDDDTRTHEVLSEYIAELEGTNDQETG